MLLKKMPKPFLHLESRGPPGDLFVCLDIEEPADIKRDGINLYSTVSVSYIEAILGTVKKVKFFLLWFKIVIFSLGWSPLPFFINESTTNRKWMPEPSHFLVMENSNMQKLSFVFWVLTTLVVYRMFGIYCWLTLLVCLSVFYILCFLVIKKHLPLCTMISKPNRQYFKSYS